MSKILVGDIYFLGMPKVYRLTFYMIKDHSIFFFKDNTRNFKENQSIGIPLKYAYKRL